MGDILKAIHELEVEARYKLLPLLAETYEEKLKSFEKNKEPILPQLGYMNPYIKRVRLTENAAHSTASILARINKPDDAMNLFAKYNTFFDAAFIANKERNMDKAKEFVHLEIKHNINVIRPQQLRDIGRILPKEELENALEPLLKKYGEDSHLSFCIHAFLAYKLGSQDKINEMYDESKNLLEKIRELKSNDSEDSTLQSCMKNHSKICQVIGKFDESIDLILESGTWKSALLQEDFIEVIDQRKDRNEIYEAIIEELNFFEKPSYNFELARAYEKLDRCEQSTEHFEEALKEFEINLDLGRAYDIAQQFEKENKIKAYTDIALFLFDEEYV